jgi:hypothetical protein
MKRISFFLAVLFYAKMSIVASAQSDPEWTFYGPQFSYVDGKITDNQFSVVEATDFKMLKNGAFIFASKKGPLTIFKNGDVRVLEKVYNTTATVKSGMSIIGTLQVAVDKNDNLFLGVADSRLFMIESKYFNQGDFSANNLGQIPAARLKEEDGFVYKTISALVNDSKGNVWVRGDISDIINTFKKDFDYKNGIAKFNGTKWETTDFNAARARPTSLVTFDEADNAIAEFPASGNQTQLYSHAGELKQGENPITSRGVPSEVGNPVAMDFYKGTVFLASANSIQVQRNGQWERLTTLGFNDIVDLKVDKAGSVWIASGEGVTCITASGAYYRLDSENSILPTNLVRKIAIDSQNKKWFVTDFGLVGYKEPTDPNSNMTVYTRYNSNFVNGKVEGLEAYENNMLLLNNDYGLMRFDGTKFTIETKSGLGGVFFNDFALNKEGHVYIGTYRFLQVYDGKSYTKLDWKDDIGKQVNGLIFDDKNTLWIASDGFSKLDNGVWQNFNKKNVGLSSNNCLKVFKDSKGNIWGILADGIAKYDGNNWTMFTKKNTDIGLRNMIGFAETKDGKLWFCNGAKLIESDGSTLKEVPSFKPVGSIRNMVAQEDGSLLIATEEKGIAKVSNGGVTFFDRSTGLPSNSISRIAKDKDNAIWVSFGFPAPAPGLSEAFNRPAPGTPAPPAPPPPSPKEVFNKKLETAKVKFGLIKLSKL